jgi:hypothetical protein
MPDLSLVFDLLARDRASSEVDKVGDSMRGAAGEADAFGDKVSGMFSAVAGTAVGAGLAVGASFVSAIEAQGANRITTAQLGLDPAQSAAAGKVAGELYAGNYGDSLEGVNEALGQVMSSLPGLADASKEATQTATRDALNFASAFGVDTSEAVQTVSSLMMNDLAPTATDAFDLLTTAYQRVPAAMRDELPAILQEYGTNFRALGFDGPQAMQLLVNAAANGQFALDKTGDAMKEFTALGVSGAPPVAAAFQAIGLDANAMSDAIAEGGPAAQAALQQTAQGLLNIEDPGTRAQQALALFGTPLEDLSVDQIPNFLAGIASVGPGMDDAAGHADQLDATLSGGVGPTLEKLKRGVETFASTSMQSLLNGFTQGGTDAGGFQGGLQNLAATVSSNLLPVLGAVSGFVTGTVLPALGGLFGFLQDHQTTVTVIAGLIGGVLAAAFTVWGTRATIAAAQNVAAWFSAVAASTTGAGTQSLSALQVVASWALMGAQAVWNGARVAAVWTAQIVASAVTGAAGFAVQVASVVAGWVAMAAGAAANGIAIAAVWTGQMIASAVSGAISFGVQVAVVVGGWVLMGVQAMIQAAQMAAAWFIALGPIGWAIAAVVGIVALIVANWDTVKNWTISAWNAVSGAVGAAWDWIKGAVASALGWLVNLFLNFTGPGLIIKHWDDIKRFTAQAWDAVVGFVTGAWGRLTGAISSGVGQAVSFMSGLPGRLLSAVGNLGSLLVSAGSDLLSGLWSGIQSMTNWLRGKISSVFGSLLPGWARDLLGIHSPSTVFADIGRDTMKGYAVGIADATPAVVDEVGQAAQAILDRMTSGQALFEDWSWLGNPDVVRRNNDQLLAEFQRSGASAADFLRNTIAAHTTPAALNLGNMVKWGDVSEEVWKQLLAQGWKGRAGDRIEAIYRPAEQPAYTPPAPVYEMPAAPPQAAPPVTYQTTVSGVASPEQVAAEVLRAQRTSEFLAGAW